MWFGGGVPGRGGSQEEEGSREEEGGAGGSWGMAVTDGPGAISVFLPSCHQEHVPQAGKEPKNGGEKNQASRAFEFIFISIF